MQRQSSTDSRFVRKDIVVGKLLFLMKAEGVSGEESFNLLKINLDRYDINIKEATTFFVEVNITKVIDAATKFHRFEICP